MAATDWQKEKLAKAWLEASKDYGDVYRQLLVNPILHELLVQKHLITKSQTPLFDAYYSWYKKHSADLSANCEIPTKWYKDWRPSEQGRTTILDLGCGDAYRGRWLAQRGRINYLGLDCSQQLLDAARSVDQFEVKRIDLEAEPHKVVDLWNFEEPPKWVFMVTLLDHLRNPDKLLERLASMYSADDIGHILVVTCNPRFYRKRPSQSKSQKVQIATIGKSGQVDVYFRSRTELRRLFRDAGLHVVDELSPMLPQAAAACRKHDVSAYNISLAPLHFWLLRAEGTQLAPVACNELEEWAAGLDEQGIETEATRDLLVDLQPHHEALGWKTIAPGAQVLAKLNLGGRLFIVRKGTLELYKGTQQANFETSDEQPEANLRFVPGAYFGELELFVQGKERERLYSTSVYATRMANSSAKVLEVPADVVQELMKNKAGLGNPMLSSLRRKVIESLMTFGNRTPWKPADIEVSPSNHLGKQGVHKKLRSIPKRHIVMAATLIARALEADRDRGAYDFEARRIVYIKSVTKAVETLAHLKARGLATPLNHAFEFLQGAGVLRLFKAVDPTKTRQDSSAEDSTAHTVSSSSREIIESVEARLGLTSYFFEAKKDPAKAMLYKDMLTCQNYRMFLVEDEILLKRFCALEPSDNRSAKLMDMLENRYLLYGDQPVDVIRARYEDLCEACLLHLKLRFDRNLTECDSLGLDLEA
jgi:2-polyprenyl-3-methyl-5-hydroxy-6-metoxy-1,4-benzoquinol methylase